MKDERGLYYYPFPQNKQVKMYVKEEEGEIWFRLWNSADPELWKDHGWIPYTAVRQAMGMYRSSNFDPERAYDQEVAKAVLRDEACRPKS